VALKPESRFIATVHKKLPSTIYREKTNNPFRSGMPDVYYEGSRGIAWVEYKYLAQARKHFTPALTKLQALWLQRACTHNCTVAVIVGSPEGAMVLPGITGVETQVTAEWQPIQNVVEWLTAAVS